MTTVAWTADDLARATKIPAGVVDVALRELANAPAAPRRPSHDAIGWR
jgi:hypothetical protein